MTQRNKPSSLPYPPQSQIPPSSSSASAVSPTYPPQPLLIRPQPPRIYEFTPQQGVEGDLLTITLASDQPGLPLKIGFGSFIADTKQLQHPTYTTLTTRVPSFSLTRCHELGVPLSIIAWSGDNEVTDSWLVGYFFYNNLAPSADDQNLGQRKRSADDPVDYEKAYKRLSGGSGTGSSASRTEDTTPSATGYMTGNAPTYSSTNQFYNIAPAPSASAAYGASGFRADETARNFFPEAGQIMGVGYPYRPPPPSQVASSTSTSQAMSDPSHEYAGARTSDIVGNPPPGMPPTGNIAMSNVPYDMSQTSPNYITPQPPPSISTDFVHQGHHAKSSLAISPSDSTSHSYLEQTSSEFNPYAQLLNKANLIIDGDLDSMALNWTPEEWDNRRRLVQFWRRQENNEIICTFAPVAPGDRQPNSIVVSCIYWEDRNECFITSVDTIFLLESLIGVRFTVEEKNRIRRNLEGFRPLTVSKLKPDSAEFFKLLMSFPNPKPRNIEKDVKAFHWKTLPLALKKIIGKYTASYSSTASVNLDALQSAYPPVGTSQQISPTQLNAPSTSTISQPPSTSQQQQLHTLDEPPQHALFDPDSIQDFAQQPEGSDFNSNNM
ncbi:hypothetical protein K450DRAFT_256278 [Umbelopsis ramanniana AG]|uniref:DUF7082 domain-containing protein n=1 Tax=Umbelopsis ramanniana AG TaxID=1314678 RepID=A0AAD5E575_UMBRA|nr:uncharacterized protein K450DRAFT_256278 [Umbelopsis ramanniana AG]KAI8576575.1 hypothetical protein K450DRAFT_256278 [Umbelopsis ramanniana AG]